MNKAETIELDLGYITKRFLRNNITSPDDLRVINPGKGIIKAYAVPKGKKVPLQALLALRQYDDSKKSIQDQMKLCFKLYKYESILSTAIDIMEEFSITQLFIDKLEGPSKVLIDFWAKYVNVANKNVDHSLKALLHRVAISMLIYGNVFPYAIWRSFDIGGRTYQLPMDVVLLNPLDMEIPEDEITLTDKKVYFKLDADLVRAFKRRSVDRTKQDKKLIEGIPPELRKRIDKNKGRIELDFNYLSHIKRKSLDHEPWGIPFLLRTLTVLNRLKSLENLDQDTLDGIINRIVFIKVGDPADPRQDEVNAVKNAMANPTQSMYLVVGPHLEKEEISSDTALLNLADRYEEIKTHLFDCLGIPINLFSGRYTAQGNRDSIAILALQERLEGIRDTLILWTSKVITQILGANKFDNLVPTVSWSKLQLKDPEAVREYVTSFFDRGILSIKSATREAGYDIDTERAARIEERLGGDDITFMIRPMPSTVSGDELIALITQNEKKEEKSPQEVEDK
jgi:hypothetical protein